MAGDFETIGVDAHNPGPMTGRGNTTWLVPGRRPVLIDAGTGDRRHLEELATALAGRHLDTVLVTHAHVDHIDGVSAVAARFPGVRFAKMPWPERDARHDVAWEPIADRQRIDAGDTLLTAIHTPGHAPDHLCFCHEESGTVFCGDLAVQGSTVVIPATGGGDLAAYLASLERIIALRPSRLLPAHGPPIEAPEALLRNYLAHRRDREGQVLDALARGAATPAAIVARIYTGLAPALVPMARESVTAHLLKLEGEGKARRDGDSWMLS